MIRVILPLVLVTGATFVAGGAVLKAKAISGTVGNDTLKGANGADIITGEAGDGSLYGLKATEP